MVAYWRGWETLSPRGVLFGRADAWTLAHQLQHIPLVVAVMSTREVKLARHHTYLCGGGS